MNRAGPDPGADPASVFVSYAHEDKARAQGVIRSLEQAGFSVWWDGLIVAGAVFAHSTEQALEAASAVVVLWSQSSVDSHWVRDEATRGRDRRCLVPVSLDGSEPPLGFRQYLFIDLSRWNGRNDAPETAALLTAVRAVHGAPPPEPAARPVRPSPRIGRRALLAGGGALAVALAGGGWLAWRRGLLDRTRMAANGVAVLPFRNMSGDAQQTYFADGVAAEVRAALARTRHLRVIAQVSSDSFRDSHVSAPGIAEALGVAFLLDGNVRRSGSTFRITTELIDGRTGFSRWGQTFDRPIDNVFAVQSEIAGSVVAALAAELKGASEPPVRAPASMIAPGGTSNVAAYDAYLRGRSLYNLAESEDSDHLALAAFEAAIALDPTFAGAHAARSRTLVSIANDSTDATHTRETYDQAMRAAETAIAIAPDFADAHSSLAIVLFQGRLDVRAARRPYELAYRLGAGDGPVVARYAIYEAQCGRAATAAPAMARALELDPLNPLMHRAMGSVLYAAHRYEGVAPAVNRALALSPRLGGAKADIGYALLALGRIAPAREAFLAESHPMVRLPGLAISEHKLGNVPAAIAAMHRLETEIGDSALYQQAQVRAQWGEPDAALAALSRALSLSDSGLTFLRTDPLLDPLRLRPEFVLLLARLGFE